MNEIKIDLKSYEESLIGGCFEPEEIETIINEMKDAKVGTIKANCWEKVSDNDFIIYSL